MSSVSQPFSDPVTILQGDVRARLRDLPDGSIDVVVTSPPYFGLRDYGTGTWEGGDPDCSHSVGGQVPDSIGPAGALVAGVRPGVDASTCRRCGATRVDSQIGLEPTPEAFVAELVAVFAEIRRVLADHGTVWLNLGDSYASTGGQRGGVANSGINQSPMRHAENGIPPRPRPGVAVAKPKDLLMVPAQVAIALRVAGWYLRSEIVWAKPNPMPESVTDRPSSSHEKVYLLSKSPHYFYDQENVREPATSGTDLGLLRGKSADETGLVAWAAPSIAKRQAEGVDSRNGNPAGGRNLRDVWQIATQPYADAHFATFPEELADRCVAAGGPRWVCQECGKPRERIVESSSTYEERKALGYDQPQNMVVGGHPGHHNGVHPPGMTHDLTPKSRGTVGWTDCGHDAYRPGRVLDPFLGSGTTGVVARRRGLSIVGVELNPEYAAMAAKRIGRFYARPRRAAAVVDGQERLFG